jgi:hypothetical protein
VGWYNGVPSWHEIEVHGDVPYLPTSYHAGPTHKLFPFSIDIPNEHRLDGRLTHNSYNSMDHTRWSGRSCLSCLAAFSLLLMPVRRNITNQGGNSLNWWPASPLLAHNAYLQLRCSSVYLETTPGGYAAVPGNATRESHEKPYCYPALRCSLALALGSTQKGILVSRVSTLSWCMHPSSISKALVGIHPLHVLLAIQQHEWQISRDKHGPDIEATFFDPYAGLATLRTARPLSPGVTGSSMALRVIPHVHPDNYAAARAKAGSVTPASKVAGGKYLSSSIDMGSAACNIQTANLSLVPSSN